MAARRIAVLALPGLQTLDVAGPVEVFHAADVAAGGGAYAIALHAPGGGAVRTSSGLRLATEALPGRPRPLDTLVVAGGEGTRDPAPDTLAYVRAAAPRARRVASVCTGAFVLAAAGLLDGRRATTHWAWCDTLARRHPAVAVDPDPIWVRDGAVWTSAGVTAGIDLALALVEDDLGADLALRVARELVVFLHRPGGQAQFSAGLAARAAGQRPLRELQGWIADHLGEDLGVARLAERAHMSERSFQRAFRREIGATPAAYVEALRVERACMVLQTSAAPVEAVAAQCGFGSVETLRRAFHRRLGVGPAAYRSRFRLAA
ncbi:MAG: GlxA family transcriptional regulator [Solirubrobacteraceae bacterium]